MNELIVVKSNHVVEASYRLTLNEQRLILLCIQQIKKGQAISAHDAFNVDANEFAQHYGVTIDRAYVLLQEVADKLYERSLLIFKPDTEQPKLSHTKTRWITAIDYIPDEGRISLYFAPKVIPYISMLESGFTRYNIEYIANMSSVYGIRLYELFKCWLMGDKTKINVIGLEDIKSLLALKDAKSGYQYPSIKDFKKHVLDRGLDDVNQHTDLKVTCESKKTGRRITHLEFDIKLKADKPKQSHTLPTATTAKRKSETVDTIDAPMTKAQASAELAGLQRMAELAGVPIESLLKGGKKTG